MQSIKWLIGGVVLSAAATVAGTLIVRLGPVGVYVGAGMVIVAGIAFITFATLALVRGIRAGSLKVSAFKEMGSASSFRLAASLVLGFLLCNGLLFLLSRPVSLSTIITVNIVVPLAWLFARYFSFRVVEHGRK